MGPFRKSARPYIDPPPLSVPTLIAEFKVEFNLHVSGYRLPGALEKYYVEHSHTAAEFIAAREKLDKALNDVAITAQLYSDGSVKLKI